MRHRLALGTAALVLLVLIAVLTVNTPTTLGQTGPSGPFGYVGAVDRVRAAPPAPTGLPDSQVTSAQVLRGRTLVAGGTCASCHSQSKVDPNNPQWLSGYRSATGEGAFQIGLFMTYSKNLTPDVNTGIGMHSDRQIFNALRYGLAPDDTPDVVITSNVPGQGNFPANPSYLAPPMPWPSYRHLPDEDLWAMVAYLKHGIKPVTNMVPDSQHPPDKWASSYTPDKIGPYPLPPYPAGNETFSR